MDLSLILLNVIAIMISALGAGISIKNYKDQRNNAHHQSQILFLYPYLPLLLRAKSQIL